MLQPIFLVVLRLFGLTLAGYLLFDEVPQHRVFFGAAIIIGCGLFIFIDEHRAEKRRKHLHNTSDEIDPVVH